VRVTERSALWGVESPDSKFFYYEGKTADTWGIWRIPVGGGTEKFVVNLRPFKSFGLTGRPGNWAIVQSGIYFINPDAKPQPDIESYNFATGKVRQITTIAKERVLRGLPGISVSSDERWILYTQGEGEFSTDIMLVENFH
jgi:Tol biopolymer transport system component